MNATRSVCSRAEVQGYELTLARIASHVASPGDQLGLKAEVRIVNGEPPSAMGTDEVPPPPHARAANARYPQRM